MVEISDEQSLKSSFSDLNRPFEPIRERLKLTHRTEIPWRVDEFWPWKWAIARAIYAAGARPSSGEWLDGGFRYMRGTFEDGRSAVWAAEDGEFDDVFVVEDMRFGVNMPKWPEWPDVEMHNATLKNFSTLRYLDWQHVNYRHEVAMPDELDDWKYVGQPWNEWDGVPIEVCLAHAISQGGQPWVHLHHQVTSLGLWEVHNRIAPLVAMRKPILEFSNEVWNANFPQYHDCVKFGRKFDLADEEFRAALSYQAAMTIKMHQVWGDSAHIVLAGQLRNPWVMEFLMQQWTVAQRVDAIAIAPYFKDASEIPELLEFVQKHRDIADAYGVELWCYEAGQDKRGAMAAKTNRSERMGEAYRLLIDGLTPLCERIVFYNAASRYGNDAWGLAEWRNDGVYPTPKFNTVQSYFE